MQFVIQPYNLICLIMLKRTPSLTEQAKSYIKQRIVNDEFEDIGEVTTRRQAERIIKRNLKDPDLFEESTYRFHRIAPADYERAVELMSDTIVCNFDDC